MKRFLLITMTAIYVLMMIATTAYATDDSIRMAFDEDKIKLIAQEDCIITLKISIQIGNNLEEISKQVELSEKTVFTLNSEDLVFEEYSDFYKDEDANIINVSIEESVTKEVKEKENYWIVCILGLGLMIFSAIIGIILGMTDVKGWEIVVGVIGGLGLLISVIGIVLLAIL